MTDPGSVIGGCQVGQFVLIECPSCPNDICYTCDCSEKKDDIQA